MLPVATTTQCLMQTTTHHHPATMTSQQMKNKKSHGAMHSMNTLHKTVYEMVEFSLSTFLCSVSHLSSHGAAQYPPVVRFTFEFPWRMGGTLEQLFGHQTARTNFYANESTFTGEGQPTFGLDLLEGFKWYSGWGDCQPRLTHQQELCEQCVVRKIEGPGSLGTAQATLGQPQHISGQPQVAPGKSKKGTCSWGQPDALSSMTASGYPGSTLDTPGHLQERNGFLEPIFGMNFGTVKEVYNIIGFDIQTKALQMSYKHFSEISILHLALVSQSGGPVPAALLTLTQKYSP
ncbi:uncharacterized protein LACBIDRAFT_327666 [Laccaria bicolor S238N-H82]|uniref:Predicted protein n=1 Tax=Laccaria bicolor (strain S238N-H82 / ATCC MYA-4686) TaxID=486041 RepID=B0DCG2_LACBS|nr:uncharacterized protein LACBIDRAFT_327666 [Laccaria bicolor S238N-H82]EDR07726.1 predicted protein [Laccaria bicolor S238N-H82]|eukprot:XP_001881515.1 predicted protein [Laccaria bicolor S238N-H82]